VPANFHSSKTVTWFSELIRFGDAMNALSGRGSEKKILLMEINPHDLNIVIFFLELDWAWGMKLHLGQGCACSTTSCYC